MLPIALALLLAWVVPQLTAQLLRAVLLRRLPEETHARRARLYGFRRAAFVVGIVQVALLAGHAARSVGPALAASPAALPVQLVGGAGALLAFVSGGVARNLAERSRTPARAVALLRLRMAPFFAGPALVASVAARMPVVDAAGAVSSGWTLAALVVTGVGVAYGGLALSLLTFAMRPATPEVTALARDVAARERTWLGPVLRLPTGAARFANAAAVPWARTMVVTDHIVSLLDTEALRAVLAHEAGHLSEAPWVGLARLGVATVGLFLGGCGWRIAAALGETAQLALVVLLALLVVAFVLVLRLARRMEKRADARAMETVGGLPLARALRAIGDDAQMPLVTGSTRRVHPDLWDRLVALGDAPGERPAVVPSRRGPLTGALLSLALVAGAYALGVALDVDVDAAADATPTRTDVALAADPWSPGAHLALAWGLRRQDDLDGSARELRRAASLGADLGRCDELRAELLAAEGRCPEACEAWRDALGAPPDPLREPLTLRARPAPPTYETRCATTCP